MKKRQKIIAPGEGGGKANCGGMAEALPGSSNHVQVQNATTANGLSLLMTARPSPNRNYATTLQFPRSMFHLMFDQGSGKIVIKRAKHYVTCFRDQFAKTIT